MIFLRLTADAHYFLRNCDLYKLEKQPLQKLEAVSISLTIDANNILADQ